MLGYDFHTNSFGGSYKITCSYVTGFYQHADSDLFFITPNSIFSLPTIAICKYVLRHAVERQMALNVNHNLLNMQINDFFSYQVFEYNTTKVRLRYMSINMDVALHD